MDSRTLILQADEIARQQGFNQSKWSTVAGYAMNGQTVSRIINNGDCRVSTFLNLLHAIGCDLIIKEGQHE